MSRSARLAQAVELGGETTHQRTLFDPFQNLLKKLTADVSFFAMFKDKCDI